MRWLLPLLVLSTACGRTPVTRCENCVTRPVVGAPDGGVDAGQPDAGLEADAGARLPCDGRPAGPDCCANGTRVSSASCVGDRWVCERGDYCECGGQPQGFSCSDFCGSDIIQPPSCLNGAWQCPRPLIQTDTCPPGTCWGEPGDLCINPMCVSGRWSCAPSP